MFGNEQDRKELADILCLYSLKDVEQLLDALPSDARTMLTVPLIMRLAKMCDARVLTNHIMECESKKEPNEEHLRLHRAMERVADLAIITQTLQKDYEESKLPNL